MDLETLRDEPGAVSGNPADRYETACAALRERVKELGCLYQIAHAAGKPQASLEEILQEVVNLLPPAWSHPESASARIHFDGRVVTSRNYREGGQEQTADIVVDGVRRGCIGVSYVDWKPGLDEGPFLTEERSLIDSVTRQVALIIERKQAEDERARLLNQLHHADRLATIGFLAAGVAHELNEPLGNILGFAQLAKKCPGLPDGAKQDLEKIENASLHARDVIKSLLVFARQMPAHKTQVSLNQALQQGLGFFEARCAIAGIDITQSLAPELPAIIADPAQLNQVLVNLFVNALQAMPGGGALRVETQRRGESVCLIVEDTGMGIGDDVKARIFDPFFTTKDVGEGTGLGLPVVHGIVASHGGSIQVESSPGRGARFEILFPIGEAEQNREKDKSYGAVI